MFFKEPLRDFGAKFEYERGFSTFLKSIGKELLDYFIPSRKDNVKRVIYKISFFAVLFAMIFSVSYLWLYFAEEDKNAEIIYNAQKCWYSSSAGNFDGLKKQNNELAGWLKIENTAVDLPFYQSLDDEYYLTNNSRKEQSRYGSLFLSSDDNTDPAVGDKNLVIYGHSVQDGSMLTDLKLYRKLAFWKQNPSLSLSTEYGRYTYVVFAVYLLNTDPDDDNGYIYHARKSNFSYDEEFTAWIDEAFQRSIINTGIDVEYGDDILTLITEADDFEGAQLVVAARRLRSRESTVINTSQAHVNPSARYPKIWYNQRGLKYPY